MKDAILKGATIYSYIFNAGLTLVGLAMTGIGAYLVHNSKSDLNIAFLVCSCIYAALGIIGLTGPRFLNRPTWMVLMGMLTLFQLAMLIAFAAFPARANNKVDDLDVNARGNFHRLADFMNNNKRAIQGILGAGFGLMMVHLAAMGVIARPDLVSADKPRARAAANYNNGAIHMSAANRSYEPNNMAYAA